MPQKTKDVGGHEHVLYTRDTYPLSEVEERSSAFYKWLDGRRTVREISDKPVSKGVIENLIMAASTAPSGAHKQPWTFCAVSSADMKKKNMTATMAGCQIGGWRI